MKVFLDTNIFLEYLHKDTIPYRIYRQIFINSTSVKKPPLERKEGFSFAMSEKSIIFGAQLTSNPIS